MAHGELQINKYIHVVMFAQIAQIAIELFDTLLMRFSTFAFEALVQLEKC